MDIEHSYHACHFSLWAFSIQDINHVNSWILILNELERIETIWEENNGWNLGNV